MAFNSEPMELTKKEGLVITTGLGGAITAGAAIGSIVPGAGTLIGAGVGAIVGVIGTIVAVCVSRE